MKFILNESKKFILNERFILNEADDEINLDDIENAPEEENGDIDLEQNTGNSSWGEGWEALYNACLKSNAPEEATEKFWYGGLPTSIQEMSETDRTKNLPIVSEQESKGYFVGEWGPKSSWVLKLKAPLVREIDKLGWTADENPFIAYLHIINNITPAAYNGVHNAYISKYILDKDLRGKDALLGNQNLLFTEVFQKLSSTSDSEDYLELQNTLRSRNTYKQFGTNLEAVFSNIFDANGKLDTKYIDTKIPITKLRSLTEIENILEAEVTQEATEEDLDELVELYKNNTAEIPGLLYYLITSNIKQYKHLKLDRATQDIIANKVSPKALSVQKMQDYATKINITYTPQQLTKIITELCALL